jgi:hypothetical protein
LKQKNVLIIIAALLVFSITCAGCLQEKETGQLPTTTPPTEVSDNSSLNTTSTEPTITATTTYPAEQSGVRIFKDADSICVGQDLNFGLINEGNSTIEFYTGNPFGIQYFINGSWGDLYWGGGTMAFWYLNPGDIKEWRTSDVELLTMYSTPVDYFKVRPGLYRITIAGRNMQTNEIVTLKTEYIIKDCEQKEPN